jgi:uncharacterized protein (DUF952 family)
VIYHVVTESDLRAHLGQDSYSPSSLAEHGFVHCAFQSSVIAVANDYFSGIAERVLLLGIDTERLTSRVQYEAAAPIAGGGSSHLAAAKEFPHVYGAIDRRAITGVGVMVVKSDGYSWPARLETLDALLEAGP